MLISHVCIYKYITCHLKKKIRITIIFRNEHIFYQKKKEKKKKKWTYYFGEFTYLIISSDLSI